jgi:D-glucuronyl C5-epimerase-like protein
MRQLSKHDRSGTQRTPRSRLVTPSARARAAVRLAGAIAAASALLALPGAAEAATVLHVTARGVVTEQEPALGAGFATGAPQPARQRVERAVTPPRAALLARTARPDAVRRAIGRAFAGGSIDAAERDRYLKSWSAALRTHRRLGSRGRTELGYVIATARRLALQKRLSARLGVVFLTLDRNREWWSKAGPPAAGARLRFGASRVIFQYFPGEGLQFHPLANFGQANGYWYEHRDGDLRSLIDDLIALSVQRSGFTTWEYYFAFGGGAPPWISAMAQGTAMQALTRASQRLSDPSLLEVAGRARGAFEQRTPVGVHAPQAGNDWYPLYSFAPRLNVLNGMLQALNGVRTYAQVAGDASAERIFAAGDRTARSAIGSYDTGAWSLYSRPGGRPGPEANLNYHTLNRDFARNLCKATGADAYCTAAANFSRYLKEDPTLDPYAATPSPATAGKGVRFRFRLSKIGRVGIVVRDLGAPGAAAGRVVFSTSASFGHGERYFRWVPPASKGEHTYEYTLYARDLAGNSGSVKGEIRVKPGRGRPSKT